MLVFRVFSPKSPNLLVDFRNEQNADKWNQSLILHDFNRCFSPELRVYQNFSYLCPRIYVHIYTIIYTLNKKIYTSVYKYFFFSNKQYHCLGIPQYGSTKKNSGFSGFKSQAFLEVSSCPGSARLLTTSNNSVAPGKDHISPKNIKNQYGLEFHYIPCHPLKASLLLEDDFI